MTELADKLVAAGKVSDVEAILEAAAAAESMAKFLVVRNLAHRVCSGAYDGSARSQARLPADMTFREFASLWVDGELHRRWPDHVDLKKTASDDAWRLRKHILPILGDLAVKDVTLDEVDDVMSALPRKLSKASRRHVAQLMVRLLHMSCYPARLRTASPIPRGWLPKLGPQLSYPILTSKEDAALLRETSIPLVRRLLYGFLHREGVRRGDAENLRWRQVDLELGTLRIEVDKTKHSRVFALSSGVVKALRAWKQLKDPVGPDELVMTDIEGKLPAMEHLADQLRSDLESAGIKRRELFEAHGGWGRFNVHTLRHSYVTRSLALGVPEDTVRQHTGHRSGELQRYREFAKSAADLAVSELTPLDEAIPEFVKLGQKLGHRLGQTEKHGPEIEKINVRNPSVLN